MMDCKIIFNQKAQIYHEARPRYPDELIDFLYDKLNITSKMVIADIGSGTGILSECFLRRGNKVICVEPNDDMINLSKINLSCYKNFEPIKATAEDTKIQSDSVDIIIAGQAFHWFEQEQFKKECLRICKKDALVIFIWNKKNDSVLEKERQAMRNSINTIQDYYQNSWDLRLKGVEKFFSGDYSYIEFCNDIVNDYETFIKRSLSDSRAPNKDDKSYNLYLDKLKVFFCKHAKDGVIIVKNKTVAFWGNLNDC